MIREIRIACPASVAEVTDAISHNRPVFIKQLFDRHDVSFPQRLLTLFEVMESRHCSFRAYELLDNEEFETSRTGQYYSLTTQRLRKMIAAHSASLDEQRRSAMREAESDD